MVLLSVLEILFLCLLLAFLLLAFCMAVFVLNLLWYHVRVWRDFIPSDIYIAFLSLTSSDPLLILSRIHFLVSDLSFVAYSHYPLRFICSSLFYVFCTCTWGDISFFFFSFSTCTFLYLTCSWVGPPLVMVLGFAPCNIAFMARSQSYTYSIHLSIHPLQLIPLGNSS